VLCILGVTLPGNVLISVVVCISSYDALLQFCVLLFPKSASSARNMLLVIIGVSYHSDNEDLGEY